MSTISNINNAFIVIKNAANTVSSYVGANLTHYSGTPYVGTNFAVIGSDTNNPVANLWLSNFNQKSYILISDNSGNFIIRDSGVGNRLTISTNGDATFAGTVDGQGFRTTSGSTDYSLLTRNSTNTAVYIQQAGSGNIVDFRYGSQAAGQGTSAMYINASGNATFAGTIISTKSVTGGYINEHINTSNNSNAYASKKWKNDDAAFGEIWRNSSTRSSAGQAALSFNMYNSADINFWSGGTHTLLLSGNNATFAGNVILDSGKYLGVGNTTPAGTRSKLGVSFNVTGSAASLAESVTYATMELYPYRDGSTYGMFFGNKGLTNGYIQSANNVGNASGHIFLNPFGGNIGIGTGNNVPGGKLHIKGDGDAANLIRLQHDGTGTNGFFDINVTDTQANLIANYSSTAIPMVFLTGASERMRISSLGVVSVGTTSPITDPFISTNQFQQLQVGRSGVMGSYTTSSGETMFSNNIYVGSTHSTFQALDTAANGTAMFLYNDYIAFKIGTTAGNGTVGVAEKMRITSGGQLFLFTQTSGTGNSTLKYTTGTGAVTFDTSSRLVKENIEDIPYGLDTVLALSPKRYKRIDSNDKIEIGFIADEVQKVVPELVGMMEKKLFTKNEEDTEMIAGSVEYEKMTAILVKSIQELKAEIELLKNK